MDYLRDILVWSGALSEMYYNVECRVLHTVPLELSRDQRRGRRAALWRVRHCCCNPLGAGPKAAGPASRWAGELLIDARTLWTIDCWSLFRTVDKYDCKNRRRTSNHLMTRSRMVNTQRKSTPGKSDLPNSEMKCRSSVGLPRVGGRSDKTSEGATILRPKTSTTYQRSKPMVRSTTAFHG